MNIQTNINKHQVSRYFRDADKSIHVYPHENNATGISPSRPAAESATMTLRQDALPAAPGQRLPSWGSSPSMAHSIVNKAEEYFEFYYQFLQKCTTFVVFLWKFYMFFKQLNKIG